jgi:RNA polymerase sigma-70 factor (ECF subfamily)
VGPATSAEDNAEAAGLRAGSVVAFEAVFRTHYAALCRLAFRFTGSREIAEEVVQDVFSTLWRKHAQLDIRGSVRAYLFAATRHRSLNQIRRHRPERLGEFEPDVVPTPEKELERSEVQMAVRAAIGSLPEMARHVVELRWLDGLSYAEIGAALGITAKTVENHLARAKQLLRERLPEHLR